MTTATPRRRPGDVKAATRNLIRSASGCLFQRNPRGLLVVSKKSLQSGKTQGAGFASFYESEDRMVVKFTVSGREAPGQISLRLQDDVPAAQVALAAFSAVYVDHGSDDDYTVHVDHEPGVAITVDVALVVPALVAA